MTATSTWIATYPKSGTTWTRFLVHRLLHGPFGSTQEVDRQVPNIHHHEETWREQLAQGGAVLATHKAHGTLTGQYGACVGGVVHVVRHPADVFLSEARFYCLSHAGKVARTEGAVTPERLDRMFREHLLVMLTHGAFTRHQRLGIGSWGAHATSWLEVRERYPHVLLRYEDLQKQPRAEVARLAAFFGVERTEAELDEVVDACSAARMRDLQQRDATERRISTLYQGEDWDTAYRMGLRFVGRAEVGDGRHLGASALERLAELFGPTMEALGYELSEESYVLPRPELRHDWPLERAEFAPA